ncbi:MAG: beta-ketoacyl synthase N-terminal-like domain-containing protein, partial [Bacteroidota bacterium]
TGIGVVSPVGTGQNDFLDSIRKGKSGIRFITELRDLNFNCQIGGLPEIYNSPYLDILKKYNLSDAGTAVLYALLAGLEAWDDAGFTLPEYNSPVIDTETGIIIGSGIGSMDIIGQTGAPCK